MADYMEEIEEKDGEKKNKKGVLRIWINFLGRFQELKGDLIKLFFIMTLLALMDNAGPLIVGQIIDRGVALGSLENVGYLFAILVGLYIAIAFVVYTFIKLAGVIEAKSAYMMRNALFKKLQFLEVAYYDKEKSGKILSRITSDCSKVSVQIGWGLVDFVYGPFLMISILIFMFVLNRKLAIILLMTLPVFIIYFVITNNKLLKMNREIRAKNAEVISLITECVSGAKTSKTLNIEEKNFSNFKKETGKMYKKTLKMNFLGGAFHPFSMLVSSSAIAILLFYGTNDILNGFMTFGELSVFLSYARFFLWPAQIMAQTLSELISSQAALERISELMDMEPGLFDKPEVIQVYGDTLNKKRENWEEIVGDIEFKNVSFWYKEGADLIENLSFKIKAGSSVALVGETGSGKSTIVNLAARFYEPKEGEILIDGRDYRERSVSWLHSNIGYVLQNPHLFSGTVKENIRYAKKDASDEEIIAACKLIGADEVIQKLDHGYDTEVGDSGSLLSTGEKQLISFARAIINDPKLFFLDEATSSVDTLSELRIQFAIQKLLKNRTSFIIAHRLSTIRDCDFILVIDKGRIVEQGNHEELMALKGKYYEYVKIK